MDPGVVSYNIKAPVLDFPTGANLAEQETILEDYIFTQKSLAAIKGSQYSKIFDLHVDEGELDKTANAHVYAQIASTTRGEPLQLVKEVSIGDGRAAIVKLIDKFAGYGPERLTTLCQDLTELSFSILTA